MEKTLGRYYFQVVSPYYQVTQGNQKYLFQYLQGEKSGLRKPIIKSLEGLPGIGQWKAFSPQIPTISPDLLLGVPKDSVFILDFEYGFHSDIFRIEGFAKYSLRTTTHPRPII